MMIVSLHSELVLCPPTTPTCDDHPRLRDVLNA